MMRWKAIVGALVGTVLLIGLVGGGYLYLNKDQFSCMKTHDINYLCHFSESFDEEVRFTTAPGKNTCGKDDGDLIEEGWIRCFDMDLSASCTTVEGSGYVTIRSGAGALAVPAADIEVVDVETEGEAYNTTLRDVKIVGLADERVRGANPRNGSVGFTVETSAFEPGSEYRVRMYLRESQMDETFSPLQFTCQASTANSPPYR